VNAKLKISLCEFQDGTFEIYVIDRETGEEVCVRGVQKFTDKERAILERLMPPCVFTNYDQVQLKRFGQ
jgi:hypothetical protein